jgi:hypothetical protein
MSKEAFKAYKSAIVQALDANADWQASKASGKADAFIKSDESSIIEDNGFIQYGLPYTPFIDAGRPKNSTNSGGLVKGIYQWLQYKKYGLSYSNDKQRLGIAIAISKNIATLGSWKFRKNEQTDVFKDVLAKAKPTLLQALQEAQRAKYTSEVLEEVKRINELER